MFATVFGYIYVALVQYLIPFIFALGVIMFLYGAINYFIIGPGEEPRREAGRHQLLWAMLFFMIGLIIYGVVAAFMWFGAWASSIGNDVEVGEEVRLQRVPDVPLYND